MSRTLCLLLATSTALILPGAIALAQGGQTSNATPPIPKGTYSGQSGTSNAGEQPQPPTPGEANSTAVRPTAPNMLIVPLVHNMPGGVAVPIPDSPVANDSEAAQRGKKFFIGYNCAGCHAPHGGGGMGLALSNAAFKFGTHPAQWFTVISHGAPLGMPAWGSVLPDNVIWDITAYISNMSKDHQKEWGTTFNLSQNIPAIEQVPAEFVSTDEPWQHTEPFSSGQKPTQHNLTTGGAGPLPSSPSSNQQ